MKYRIIVLMIMTMLLSACAFHFRNQADFPPTLKSIYISDSSANNNSHLASQLSAYLENLGIVVVNAPNKAPVTLHITNDTFSQSSSTIGTAQQLNNVWLNYTVTFVLEDRQGKQITAPSSLTTSTSYLQNANQVLGDTIIVPQLEQNLVRDMIQRILAKLTAKQTVDAIAAAS